ncbi:hypothetical protein K458DRAFT_311113 [Lentithecium fluviatile CBS 122367]|uniref:DUF2423 domain-containing protein n=1 Tax=Lentithecium fluviatile CBS 122367 TaxID=1168545 RepID=A0A6G1IRY8_9PLEO|nr:hypothetical protein K458DRAFT_311113 [Lentithecium fluviatile CBS 122367]
MAKGLRSSVKKSNRTKLRSRVFEPVENARLERLHQKLLETAQQPKPDDPKKNEMEIDSGDDANAANEASNEDEFSKGLSFLSARVPRSLSGDPATSTDKPAPYLAQPDSEGDFYHFLGLCTDVVGFTSDGGLEFAFGPHTPHGFLIEMDIDGAPAASKSKPKDRKAIRKARKLRRTKPKNQMSFPATRGKGALKPFSESRVRKRRS